VKLIYDTTECSRCWGSGRYSFTPMYGDTCFQCEGRKKTLSKAGEKAKALFDELVSVEAKDLKPGMEIKVALQDPNRADGFSSLQWDKIREVVPFDYGVTTVYTEHRRANGWLKGYSSYKPTQRIRIKQGDKMAAIVEKVMAYQATIAPDGGTAEGYEAREAKREARREATAKRREARAKKKAEELATKRAEFLDQNPIVNEIWEAYQVKDPRVYWGPDKEMSFLESVVSKLESYSSLSEKQVAALIKAWGRANDRAREDAEPKGPAPSGRVEVTGKVLGVKTTPSQWGDQVKMIVKLENKSKVWVSVPANLLAEDLRGKTIELTATFEVSKDDPHFAFGKRPKAKLKA
jgi:hypothetical protein